MVFPSPCADFRGFFHFLSAAALAWVLRGNILAALLGTFFGNPFTFPLIVVGAMETGSLILGQGHMATPRRVMSGFKSVLDRNHGQSSCADHASDGQLGADTQLLCRSVFALYAGGGLLSAASLA